MQRPSLFAAALATGVLLHSFSFAAEGKPAKPSKPSKASEAVQQALQAEAKGEIQRREYLLQDAAEADKQDSMASWLSGKIRVGSDWQSYEEVLEASESSSALKQYLKAREDAEPTVASQQSLALLCERLRLKNQAQAHWYALLQLTPDDVVARQHLGFVQEGNKWVIPDKEKEAVSAQQQIALALKSEQGELLNLQRGLKAHRITIEDAAEKLAKSEDVSHFPAWEQYVSAGSTEGGKAVVAALNKLTAPEAAHSLLRHALFHFDPQVKAAAVAALKGREEQSYYPPLIGALRGPWVGQARTIYDPISQQRVTRYSASSEKQDAQEMTVIDDAYLLTGDISRAGSIASSAGRRTELTMEQQRQQANAQIGAQNRLAMALLKELSGEKALATPQEWWKWWEQHCESISANPKAIETSYAYRTSEVYAETPPPVPPITKASPPPSTGIPYHHECLAAGTLILTNRGPIGVEQVRLGDLVLSRHPVSGETTFKPVILTTNRPPENLLQISFGNDIIRASGGHPFWVSGKGWLRARELKEGMVVHGLAAPAEITSIAEEEEPAPSFNMVVDGFHSYFVQVGEVRVLTHDNSLRDPIRTTVPGLKQVRRE